MNTTETIHRAELQVAIIAGTIRGHADALARVGLRELAVDLSDSADNIVALFEMVSRAHAKEVSDYVDASIRSGREFEQAAAGGVA